VSRARLSSLAAREFLLCAERIADANPHAALEWVDAVERALSRMAAYPKLGHRRDDLTEREVRFYRVSSHLLVYRTDTDPPLVIDIVHSARDIPSRLRGDE